MPYNGLSMKRWVSIIVLFLVLLGNLPLISFSGKSAAAIPSLSTAPQASINYVVIIMMENHPLNVSACCGGPNGIIGNSAAPYINELARNYSLAGNYFAVASGSLPDYLSMTGGSTFQNIACVSNDTPPSASCSIPGSNIVDRVEASGRTWKAYMEDYTGGCFGTNIGSYDYFHNPFPYFADVQNNTQRCSRIVSANSGHTGLPDDQLISDLNSTSTAPNFLWLTPNEYNNMHGYNGQPGSISTGDSYLAQLVPAILRTPVFKTSSAAVFITWDEPTTCSSGIDLSCPVPGIWVGPAVRANDLSMKYYTHFSVLATLESLWNLSPLTSNDTGANPMIEFFNPASQTLSLSNGGKIGVVQGGSVYDNITATLAPNASPPGPSLTMSCKDLPVNSSCSFNPTSYTCTSTCISLLRILTNSSVLAGTYSITVAATNGTLTSSSQITLTVLKPFQLPGDTNGDCLVDISDLTTVAQNFGQRVGPGTNPRTDIDLDGKINVFDLVAVAINFGKRCP